MKKIIMILLVVVMSLYMSGCKKKNNQETKKPEFKETLYQVKVKSGLFLRANPNIKADKIILLPYMSVLKTTSDTTMLPNFIKKPGKWINVEWSQLKKKGWVFDAYLEPFNATNNSEYKIKIIDINKFPKKLKSKKLFGSGDDGCSWNFESEFNIDLKTNIISVSNSYTHENVKILSIKKDIYNYNIKVKSDHWNVFTFNIIQKTNGFYVYHDSDYLIEGFPSLYIKGEARDMLNQECEEHSDDEN